MATQSPPPSSSHHAATDAQLEGGSPRRVSSTSLLAGARELIVEHRGEHYRLRLTSNDKLILTK